MYLHMASLNPTPPGCLVRGLRIKMSHTCKPKMVFVDADLQFTKIPTAIERIQSVMLSAYMGINLSFLS